MIVNQAQNHFDLFGLPVGFVLDTAALAERYRKLQKMMHPDQYANASGQEKRLALQQSMQINAAYDQLRDPLSRAIYLLELHGVSLNEQAGTTQDGDFLVHQMMLRERLAEIRQPDELDDLMAEISQMIKTQIAQLALQFEAGFESATPDQLAAARESIHKMQFLHKLRHEAESVEADLAEIT